MVPRVQHFAEVLLITRFLEKKRRGGRIRLRGLSKQERRAAEGKRAHALFEEIQFVIHHGERVRVEYLMVELAMATGK